MIETYHLIFQISLGVSIVLLVALFIYCIVFRVGYAISWLTGHAKKKEMKEYNSNATPKVSKKSKKSKKMQASPQYTIKTEHMESSYVQSEEQPVVKMSTVVSRAEVPVEKASETDIFEETPRKVVGTDVFEAPQKKPGTDIFEDDDEEDIFLSVGNVISDNKTDFVGTDILDDTAI